MLDLTFSTNIMLNVSFLVLEESKCLFLYIAQNSTEQPWLKTLKYLEFLRMREFYIRQSDNYRNYTIPFANCMVGFSKNLVKFYLFYVTNVCKQRK